MAVRRAGKIRRSTARTRPPFVETDAAIAFEVQADFDAAGMKTFAPVEFLVRLEIMPLKAHARATHAAVQMPPAVADRAPRRAFGERGATLIRGVDCSRFVVFPFWHGDNVPFSWRRANILSSSRQEMSGANHRQ